MLKKKLNIKIVEEVKIKNLKCKVDLYSGLDDKLKSGFRILIAGMKTRLHSYDSRNHVC